MTDQYISYDNILLISLLVIIVHQRMVYGPLTMAYFVYPKWVDCRRGTLAEWRVPWLDGIDEPKWHRLVCQPHSSNLLSTKPSADDEVGLVLTCV